MAPNDSHILLGSSDLLATSEPDSPRVVPRHYQSNMAHRLEAIHIHRALTNIHHTHYQAQQLGRPTTPVFTRPTSNLQELRSDRLEYPRRTQTFADVSQYAAVDVRHPNRPPPGLGYTPNSRQEQDRLLVQNYYRAQATLIGQSYLPPPGLSFDGEHRHSLPPQPSMQPPSRIASTNQVSYCPCGLADPPPGLARPQHCQCGRVYPPPGFSRSHNFNSFFYQPRVASLQVSSQSNGPDACIKQFDTRHEQPQMQASDYAEPFATAPREELADDGDALATPIATPSQEGQSLAQRAEQKDSRDSSAKSPREEDVHSFPTERPATPGIPETPGNCYSAWDSIYEGVPRGRRFDFESPPAINWEGLCWKGRLESEFREKDLGRRKGTPEPDEESDEEDEMLERCPSPCLLRARRRQREHKPHRLMTSQGMKVEAPDLNAPMCMRDIKQRIQRPTPAATGSTSSLGRLSIKPVSPVESCLRKARISRKARIKEKKRKQKLR